MPPGPKTALAIQSALSATYPSGQTPLGATFEAARGFLGNTHRATKPQTVILLTDGMESCGGNPVAEASKLLADGVETYVVGFGGGVDPEMLGRIATVGGTGSYAQADDLAQLTAALTAIARRLACCGVCSGVCGNGVLDAGERCDTAIGVGEPGACPEHCDDGDPCTADQRVGSGCTTDCLHLQLCGCGNGQLEGGERCDPAIAVGKPGACPTAADCDDGDPCTRDRVDGTGCQQRCVHIPVLPQTPGSDGCCLPGTSSLTDVDCPPPCGPDKTSSCVDLCATVSCPDRHYCIYGRCEPSRWQAEDGTLALAGCCSVATTQPPPMAWLGLLLALALAWCRSRR